MTAFRQSSGTKAWGLASGELNTVYQYHENEILLQEQIADSLEHEQLDSEPEV